MKKTWEYKVFENGNNIKVEFRHGPFDTFNSLTDDKDVFYTNLFFSSQTLTYKSNYWLNKVKMKQGEALKLSKQCECLQKPLSHTHMLKGTNTQTIKLSRLLNIIHILGVSRWAPQIKN